jgi:hypothetical protein
MKVWLEENVSLKPDSDLHRLVDEGFNSPLSVDEVDKCSLILNELRFNPTNKKLSKYRVKDIQTQCPPITVKRLIIASRIVESDIREGGKLLDRNVFNDGTHNPYRNVTFTDKILSCALDIKYPNAGDGYQITHKGTTFTKSIKSLVSSNQTYYFNTDKGNTDNTDNTYVWFSWWESNNKIPFKATMFSTPIRMDEDIKFINDNLPHNHIADTHGHKIVVNDLAKPYHNIIYDLDKELLDGGHSLDVDDFVEYLHGDKKL